MVYQAMVTRFPSISTRKLSNALTILTNDKCMVATSDYNDFHKTVKKHILNYLLGPSAQVRDCNSLCKNLVNVSTILLTGFLDSTIFFAQKLQKGNRSIRETMLKNVVDHFNTRVKSRPLQAVNFREIFESELFGLSLKQVRLLITVKKLS